MAKHRHRRLSKTGKIIVTVGIVVAIALTGGIGYGIYSWLNPEKPSDQKPSEQPVVSTTPIASSDPSLASVYDPIYQKYHDLNSDYVAYLEWENDLLYNYDSHTVDQYPHVIVRSSYADQITENRDMSNPEFAALVNSCNAQYLRTDINHQDVSYGQEFMDAANTLDENGIPMDQNLIIYGHYVYEYRYEQDKLKFTPLDTLCDPSVYDQYDTFTLTFNGQQRTYQVAHAFYYEKASYNTTGDALTDYLNCPFNPNYTAEQLSDYMDRIENEYGDFIETDVPIHDGDSFVTLQTCVENDESRLFIVIGKEIDRVDF